ncbi:MAG: FAD-dependent oxidoreductase [Hyphomonas sp.]|uniref:NAD(P)/FAD-dependent oxidoreductase n=1 Tax=Hyphomonas sp. TaxID=87 RepID=UPI0017A3C5FD|nr:FAD-dependent oxidoreductase [Hyphomonas sp.]MBA3069691.1 FAD-dependent oxidoreductase [Hyphomonas sp.]MBU4062532.1 FAD-dependent oxidoreductase [Alphaproteobacteria bacterium]MBU4163883.1 FAD-dependent oxidoreductase [Alphaproteobacteria bacterium]
MTRIAIIGAGISGLGAAWALRDRADVTLFEKDDRLGGHACTHSFNLGGMPVNVDLGFIVYNGLNYPNLIGFFEALKVETEASDMSFSVTDPEGWTWASTAAGIFAQKRNLLSPRFHKFWTTILKFNDTARRDLASGRIDDPSLGAWLDRHGFDADFRANYILPMGAAIWSTPEDRILDYPARSFFQFFDNHRLMHKERPKWRTVTGGSQNYVRKAGDALGGRVRLNSPIARVHPFGGKIAVVPESGRPEVFDEVILTCHSDQALRLVEQDYEAPAFYLRSVKYRPNTIYLHCDPALMPARKAAWASWNVLKQPGGDICLTYWMNKLQNIAPQVPVFITLNPATPPAPDLILHRYSFDHPQFDAAAEAAVRSLGRIQGQDGLWFAGAWMGRGFHEDGLKSGLAAALSLGGEVPWETKSVDLIVRRRNTSDYEVKAEATA